MGFKPKIRFNELEYYLHTGPTEKTVRNSRVYGLVKKLVSKAFPSQEDEFDKRWDCFYLPVKRSGKTVCVPFHVMEYKKEFYAGFHLLGMLHVKKGGEKVEKIYENIFRQALLFVEVVKDGGGEAVRKTLPYDFRTGRIKGRHVMKKLLRKKEAEAILKKYEESLSAAQTVEEISLNDYLSVASICCKAAFGKKAENLSPIQTYKKWADGRDGGMLSIRNRDSGKEFADWLENGEHAGSHPFEIVFSWHRHGIHLYPPRKHKPRYALMVTDYAYAKEFVKMVDALIKNKIAFEAFDLQRVLDFLAGETYFTVNDYDEHSFFYAPSREYKKLYFKHVEWDELKTLEWKARSPRLRNRRRARARANSLNT